MRDPHVEWLEYDLQTTWTFDNPPAIRSHCPDFDITLHNAVLRADMVAHFETEEGARAAVEPYLQAWELDVALAHRHREMTFTFKQAQIVDRNPPPPGWTHVGELAITVRCPSFSGTGKVIRKTYPAVPTKFIVVPDVMSLWNRFEGYKAGREPIASMAYFCLTLVQHRYGGREAACKTLSISEAVLDKVATLSTYSGDNLTARKVTPKLRPLTEQVTQWLEAALLALIRRVGEIASGHSPAQLTMEQLPRL